MKNGQAEPRNDESLALMEQYRLAKRLEEIQSERTEILAKFLEYDGVESLEYKPGDMVEVVGLDLPHASQIGMVLGVASIEFGAPEAAVVGDTTDGDYGYRYDVIHANSEVVDYFETDIAQRTFGLTETGMPARELAARIVDTVPGESHTAPIYMDWRSDALVLAHWVLGTVILVQPEPREFVRDPDEPYAHIYRAAEEVMQQGDDPAEDAVQMAHGIILAAYTTAAPHDPHDKRYLHFVLSQLKDFRND